MLARGPSFFLVLTSSLVQDGGRKRAGFCAWGLCVRAAGPPGKEKQWPLSLFGCSCVSALTCLLLFTVEELATSPDPRCYTREYFREEDGMREMGVKIMFFYFHSPGCALWALGMIWV